MNIKFQVSIFKNDVARGGGDVLNKLATGVTSKRVRAGDNDNQIENIDSVEI